MDNPDSLSTSILSSPTLVVFSITPGDHRAYMLTVHTSSFKNPDLSQRRPQRPDAGGSCRHVENISEMSLKHQLSPRSTDNTVQRGRQTETSPFRFVLILQDSLNLQGSWCALAPVPGSTQGPMANPLTRTTNTNFGYGA